VKILHITESYGGGVASAINSFAKNTSDQQHFLYYTNSRGMQSEPPNSIFEDIKPMHFKGFLSILRLETSINRLANELKVDIVHLHSSFAGVIGRFYSHVFRKANPSVKIVYSPHCFAFERQDISPLVKKLFYLIEKAFARRTDVFALCSKREQELALVLIGKSNKRSRTVFVPNVSHLPIENYSELNTFTSRSKNTITSGRDCPQKNFKFLTTMETEVEILPHLSSNELSKKLNQSKIFIITSLWEGFPIAILDAIRAKMAIIALKRPYLADAPTQFLFNTPSEADQLISELLNSQEKLIQCANMWTNAYDYCIDINQTAALKEVYSRQ
jgi:glycosyltransferase involved in cell wall biosynthesis